MLLSQAVVTGKRPGSNISPLLAGAASRAIDGERGNSSTA